MKTEYRIIKTDEEIEELSVLARKIWNIHYPPIIGQDQVNYMLELMYTEDSLRKQIFEDKNVFTGAFINGKMAGFISVSSTDGKNYFLHKLYVDSDLFHKGIGKGLFEHVFSGIDFDTIRLTVNRQNFKAINFYFKTGYKIEKIIDIDIGGGFVMNDFVMLFEK